MTSLIAVPSLPPMTPAMSRALGEHFEHIAAALKAQAEMAEADERGNARRRERAEAARRATSLVDRLTESGIAPDEAIDKVAELLQIERAQLAVHWRTAGGKPGRVKAARNRRIMRLAARGWSDAEIAAHMTPSLHPKSVNRIVRHMLRASAKAGPMPGSKTPAQAASNDNRGAAPADHTSRLLRLLRRHAPAATPRRHSTLTGDLRLDTSALAVLAREIGAEFSVEMSGPELAACATLGHLARLIEAKTLEAAAALAPRAG